MTAAVNLRGSGAHPNDVVLHDVSDAPDLPQAGNSLNPDACDSRS
jgi:hypothetical protein